MKKHYSQHGQSLLEAVLGIGLLIVISTGALSVSFRYLSTLQRAIDIKEVSFVAQEGLEAVHSIGYDSWESIQDGTYGLNSNGGTWQLQAIPDQVSGRYTRTILVESVQRAEDCSITEVAGTTDPDTKKITLTVEWFVGNTPLTQSVTTYVTNWNNPEPLCAQTQAGNLSINVSIAHLGTTKKQVEGITIENLGISEVTIDKLIVAWIKEDGTSPGEIESVKIDGTDVWHKNLIEDVFASFGSGSTLDIADVTIPSGQIYDVDRIRFDEKLDGAQFTLTVIMGDESQTEVVTEGFLP